MLPSALLLGYSLFSMASLLSGRVLEFLPGWLSLLNQEPNKEDENFTPKPSLITVSPTAVQSCEARLGVSGHVDSAELLRNFLKLPGSRMQWEKVLDTMGFDARFFPVR